MSVRSEFILIFNTFKIFKNGVYNCNKQENTRLKRDLNIIKVKIKILLYCLKYRQMMQKLRQYELHINVSKE